jgi:hypothetical protein
MTYHKMHVRSGLAAIAAMLALSSTPLAAQEVTAPPEPVTETPSEPAATADPLAPEPAAAEEPAASGSEQAAPTTIRRTASRTRTATASRVSGQPVRSAAPAIAPEPSAGTADPVAISPAPIGPAAGPAVEPAAPPVAPVKPSGDLLTDEAAPVAGAAGLGLLALAGAGLAVNRRRRRRKERAHQQANRAYLDQHPAEPEPAAREPAFVRAGQPAAVAASASALSEAEVRTDVPRTKLPNGFDLSRFGPHVRAAYLGPTPDNPSLSLKYRLRRAAAMDQRARLEAERRPQVQRPAMAAKPASKPVWRQQDEGFMLRRAGSAQPSRSNVH